MFLLLNLEKVYDYHNEVGGHHGELKRPFKGHIQMIYLGGCIGSGIFISTGKVRIFIRFQRVSRLTLDL